MVGNLHVRNLDDDLIARLKRRAVRGTAARLKPSIGKSCARLSAATSSLLLTR
jgi:hypothetical protein